MRKKLIVLVLLGLVLLIGSFSTEFIMSNKNVWATKSYADSQILFPLTESLMTLDVNRTKSIIKVLVTANSTLVIEVLHDDKAEWRWENIELKNNVLLHNAGLWSIRILNNSTTSYCNYTSIIELSEPYVVQGKFYLWLRLPLLVLSAICISSTAPIYFFNKYGSRLNKEALKTIMVLALLLIFLFSYQIAGFMLQTRFPWVVERGVSMEPTMCFGDLIVITGMAPQKFVLDEIILFQKISLELGGEDFSTMSLPVLHRILHIYTIDNYRYFTTKGDNSDTADEWYVPEEGVLGKAILIMPKLGYVFIILERIEVKICIIAAIFFVGFVWPAIKPKKAIAKAAEDVQR